MSAAHHILGRCMNMAPPRLALVYDLSPILSFFLGSIILETSLRPLCINSCNLFRHMQRQIVGTEAVLVATDPLLCWGHTTQQECSLGLGATYPLRYRGHTHEDCGSAPTQPLQYPVQPLSKNRDRNGSVSLAISGPIKRERSTKDAESGGDNLKWPLKLKKKN